MSEALYKRSSLLFMLLLASAAFSLATLIQTRNGRWSSRTDSDDVLKVLLGDSRRLFANHFFVQADVSFHSGYYPSIFDTQQRPKEKGMEMAGGEHEAQEKEEDFLGKPRDWIERFGRHFRITEHTHLEGNTTREILPWLRLSAELDPQRVETYTVAAYWLRSRLNEPAEA